MFAIVATLMLITASVISSGNIRRNVADDETPVTDFRGVTSEMYNHSSSVNLRWKIRPINATVFWIHIFKDEYQIYGFSFSNPEKFAASSEFQGRLAHNVYNQDDAFVFQLTLTDPQSSDTGVYVGELYGSGSGGHMKARLNLTYENAKTPNASNHTAGDSGEKAESNIIVPFFIAIMIAVTLVITITIIVNKWKKRSGENNQKEKDSEETSSLQKPSEGEETSTVKYEWKRLLCHTDGKTEDRKSKEFGDKEDEDDEK